MSGQKAIIIIPARYEASRFPGKPLTPILGRPMIQHVYEGAMQSNLAEKVIVATDSPEIRTAVEDFGGLCEMTSPDHASGTDRIWEVADGHDCDIVINLQGDEPLVRGNILDTLIQASFDDPGIEMATLCKKFDGSLDPENPSRVKVVRDTDGNALYFSRSPIPFYQTGGIPVDRMLHIGIYLFRRDFLKRFVSHPQTPLEICERLEQLRALEMGTRIWVGEITEILIGVDEPSDVKLVEKYLSEREG